MSPTRTGPGGCYRFDRLFRGVGRIQCSSGAKRLPEYRRRDGLLTKLYEQGRLDLLRALKAGTITVGELVDADRRERLPQAAADLVADRPLWATVYATVRRMVSCNADTRIHYRNSWKALERAGVLPADARLADLLRVPWRALEARWGFSAANWNHLRRAVSRTLTVLLEAEAHPFRLAVLKDFPSRQEIDREPDLSPVGFWEIIAHLRPDLRPFFVTLVATGLRGGELLQLTRADLMPLTTSIRVRRKVKNRWSVRVLPMTPVLYAWLDRAVPMPLKRDWLREKWYQACDAAGIERVRLHDLRHCFGQWTLDAGAMDRDIQKYLGHATAYMTNRYRARLERRSSSEAMEKALGVPLKVPQEGSADAAG